MNQKFDFLTNALEDLKAKALSEPAIESKLAESFELSSKVAQLTDEVNNNLPPLLHFQKLFFFKKNHI
jgi:cell shape-determining protein MreC